MLTPSEIASTSSAAYFDMAYGSSGGNAPGVVRALARRRRLCEAGRKRSAAARCARRTLGLAHLRVLCILHRLPSTVEAVAVCADGS